VKLRTLFACRLRAGGALLFVHGLHFLVLLAEDLLDVRLLRIVQIQQDGHAVHVVAWAAVRTG
jgi:hypothetical protein